MARSLYRFQFESGRSVLVPMTDDEIWAYSQAMLNEGAGAVVASKVKGLAIPFTNADKLEYIIDERRVVRGGKAKTAEEEVRLSDEDCDRDT